jgi:hypothetical protein
MYGYEPDYDERSESEYERDVVESNDAGGVLKFEPGSVWLDPGTGEFSREG